jgi:hypothetical protein
MFGDLIKQNIVDAVRRAVLRALDSHKKSDLRDPLVREQVAEDVSIELKAAFDRGLLSLGAAARDAGRIKRRMR